MRRRPEDRLFQRFRESGDPRLLGRVFDRTAPELMRVGRYLARGDAALAEDLLQSTFLTAIEDASSWQADRPLLPWLLGILVRRAHTTARGEARRRVRERAAGVPDAGATGDPVDRRVMPPDRHAELREAAGEVGAALRALPEPYGKVLLLHLEHGLTAREIGGVLDRPAGTVRTQIVRGLELLRGRLPAGLVASAAPVALAPAALGEVRAAVCAAAEATLPAGASVAVASAWLVTLGGWSMLVKIGVVLGGLCLAVVLAHDPGAPAPPATPATPATVARGGPAPSPAPNGADAAAAPARTAVPAPLPGADAARALPDHIGALCVRVVDPGHQPVADVGVELAGIGMRHTDAAGEVRWPSVRPGHHSLKIQAGLLHFVDVLGGREQTVELAFRVGRDVVVRVESAAGEPVADAVVELGTGPAMWPAGRTSAGGQVVLRGMSTDATVRAYAAGHGPSAQQRLQPATEPDDEILLTLGGPSASLRVNVVGPDLAPLGDAVVAVEATGENWSRAARCDRAGADGVCALVGLAPGRYVVTAQVRDAERVARARVAAELAAGERGTLRVVLDPLRMATLFGRALDGEGMPMRGQSVRAEWLDLEAYDLAFANDCAPVAEDGSFELRGLMPGRYRLAAGNGTQTIREEVELVPGERRRWDAHAARSRSVALRVVDETGAALAGWRVGRCRADLGGVDHLRDADDAGCVRLEEVPFDAFVVAILRPPPVFAGDGIEAATAAAVEAAEAQRSAFPVLRVEVPAGLPEFVVRVPATHRRPGSVRGLVRDHAGAPVEEVSGVVLQLRQPRPADPMQRVDTDADGAFEFAGVPPGRYALTIWAPGTAGLRRLPIEVVPGRDTDLGVVRLEQGTPFRLVPAADQPSLLEGLRGVVWREGTFSGGLPAVPAGGLPCGRLRAGTYHALLVGPRVRAAMRTFTVDPSGPTELVVRLQPAETITFRLHATAGDDPLAFDGRLQVRAAGDDALVHDEPFAVRRLAGARSCDLRRGLAPGRYRVTWLVGGAAGSPRAERSAAVDVLAGQAHVVDLRQR